MKKIMKIGFIGAGKVGIAFGMYLKNKEFNVIGYSSRSLESLELATDMTNSKVYSNKEIVLNSDVILITVNDNNLQDVLNDTILNIEDLNNKSFIHMSGAYKSDVFKNAYDKGAKIYSLHPLQSFASIEESIKSLEKTIFSIESYDGMIDKNIENILLCLNDYFQIDGDKKAIYHMAATVFSNYLVTLMDFALELTSSIGMDKELAFKAMRPLVESTIKNIEKNGIEQSLTGPLARGDINTIKTHIKTYDDNNQQFKEFYEFMGIKTLEYISKNNLLEHNKLENLNVLLGGKNEENNN